MTAAMATGAPIQAADTLNIIDDDSIGGVTTGGKFCLDIRTMGMLEGECRVLPGCPRRFRRGQRRHPSPVLPCIAYPHAHTHLTRPTAATAAPATAAVWTGPLTGGRFSAVLFNRSPSADNITLSWATDLSVWGAPVPPSARFSVRSVWEAEEKGVFTTSYTATGVPAHGVAMLILTPA